MVSRLSFIGFDSFSVMAARVCWDGSFVFKVKSSLFLVLALSKSFTPLAIRMQRLMDKSNY